MYKVIIPSFKRPETIIKKTLKVLQSTNVNLSELYVFVADTDEQNDYENKLAEANIKATVVVGVRGIPNQRNFIQDYFPEGEQLFFIDDDISALKYFDGTKKAIQLKDLDTFIKEAFAITHTFGFHMWGVNANCNPLNMQNRFSAGLIYLVGNLFGLINTHDRKYYVDEGDLIPSRKNYSSGKESHERALKMYLHDGGVIKFKNVGVESKYWGEPGGHQVARTKQGELDATNILCAKYPQYLKARIFNDIWDITFVTGKTKTYPTNQIN